MSKRICPFCQNEFVIDVWHPKQVTCGNVVCGRKYYKVRHNDKIKKDAKKYREQRWFSNLREKVLQRDKYKCNQCGAIAKSNSVHHKDGKGRGFITPNNILDNLITLCNSCHQKEHWKDKRIYDKPKYLLRVAEHWDKSDREIGRILNCSHPTVAILRRELAKKISNSSPPFLLQHPIEKGGL